MTDEATLGLRDRKRIRTRAQIEAAALTLVLRDGLEATTIDAISERADVSPRTFFNYFDSKDAAILGLPQDESETDVEVADIAQPGDGILDAVVRLVASTMGGSMDTEAGVRRDRIEVIRRHPEVLGGQLARLRARGDRLQSVIGTLLAADPAHAEDPDRAARAEMLLTLAGTAFRIAVREWAEPGSPAAGADPTDTIQQRAVALVTETARTLS